MNKQATSTRLAIIISAAYLLVPTMLLLRVVNPIDVLTGETHVLAEEKLPSGETLQLIQFWNGEDFYTTKLKRTAGNDVLGTVILDGGDSKIWFARITPNANANTLDVYANGAKAASLTPSANEVIVFTDQDPLHLPFVPTEDNL